MSAMNDLTLNANELSLRPADLSDETFLFEVFASTHFEGFQFLDWDDRQKEALLRMQYDLRRRQYDAGYPHARSSIILLRSLPIGSLLVNDGEQEMSLVDIALLSDYRNLGIGGRLIGDLLRRAADKQKPVRLHVLKSNPALRLYQRLGFHQVAEDGTYLEMLSKVS